jgi:hypothetical protein
VERQLDDSRRDDHGYRYWTLHDLAAKTNSINRSGPVLMSDLHVEIMSQRDVTPGDMLDHRRAGIIALRSRPRQEQCGEGNCNLQRRANISRRPESRRVLHRNGRLRVVMIHGDPGKPFLGGQHPTNMEYS